MLLVSILTNPIISPSWAPGEIITVYLDASWPQLRRQLIQRLIRQTAARKVQPAVPTN